MNGPTRSSAFERHGPVGAGNDRSADIYDELDQFVDSEPAVWGPAQRPTSGSIPSSPAAQDSVSRREMDPRRDPDPRIESELRGDQYSYGDPDPYDAREDPFRDDDPRFDDQRFHNSQGDEAERPALGGRGEPRFSRPHGGMDADPAPVFSSEGADRRSKFTQRLNEELARPSTKPADAPRAADAARPEDAPRQGGIFRAPDPAQPRGEGRARDPLRPQAPEDRRPPSADQRPADQRFADQHSGEAKPAPPSRGLQRTPRGMEPAPGVPVATGLGMPPAAGPVPDWKRDRSQPADAPEPPADALDWELGNAIGKIIAGGRAAQASAQSAAPAALPPATVPPAPEVAHTPPAEARLPVPAPTREEPPAASIPDDDEAPQIQTFSDDEDDGALETSVSNAPPPRSRATPVATDIPLAAARTASGSRDSGLQPPVVTVKSPVDLSGKRVKPIPSFRYQRREEPAEPFPAAPPDLDDPLASVFLSDARDAFDATRPGAYADYGEDDAFEEFETEEYEFEDEEADEDDLPPSLRRASRPTHAGRRRRVGRRVALAAVCLGGVAAAGVLGLNLFAGSDGTAGAPPIIRADARDVKTRPEDEGPTARPEIDERAALGDNDRLVVPDPVRISPQQAPPAPDYETEARSVRTVTVRPDGTIMPTRSAAASTSRPSEAAPSSYDVAAADPDVQSDAPEYGAPEYAAPGTAATNGAATGRPGTGDAAPSETAGSSAPGYVGTTPTAGEPVTEITEDDSFEEVDTQDLAALGTDAGSGASAPAGTVPVPRPTPPHTARSTPAPTQTQTQTTPPTAVASNSPAAAPAPSMPWGVQLASRRERASAVASFQALQQRYPSLLGNATPLIVAANVGDRGTFYRLRVGASSFGEANQLCERLKRAGADCFVGRN
ncbi:SPOR domain-containing protein [Acuticoccus sp. I52.16.1]|uniref:SPOR domain-containing protein n=1 Tax=Acuticoccus sp. I52.16.1 TaxID=2928472 RepID=UPI001FD33A89|nr:SPOR domain-containing protein [Acuticoccus sp. I52.16.1]UOM34533.1 SPOR domain-containing protein [Acuticoccus sp. I52.16.1]